MSNKLKSEIITLLERVVRQQAPGAAKDCCAIEVEIPKDSRFGDWSLNIAMRLKKELRQPPLKIAEALSVGLQSAINDAGLAGKIDKIEVKQPGFINIFLSDEALGDVLNEVAESREEFGRYRKRDGERILIEFVSANPTGPLSIAHARQAAVGDSLARILEFCGYDVKKEYYINDEGNQIRNLGLSLRARYLEKLGIDCAFPEDGYKGEYLYGLADELIAKVRDKYASDDSPEALEYFSAYAAARILKQIREELKIFAVEFDNWYSQKNHITEERISAALAELKSKGYIYEQDGATWFRSTEFGDDKDRVVIKSDGQYTYLTPDISYHKLKYERGFTRLINIWGPDHHGYINRIKAAVRALGHDPRELAVIIIQLATLFRDGKPVVMSTRAGEYITLSELVEEVGQDAARFFFLMRRCESQLEFDLELAKKHTMDNPVYYVQYAHARISGIKKVLGPVARECGYADVEEFARSADLSCLKEEEARSLIRKINGFSAVLEACAKNLDPQGLTNYLRELASEFHSYYNKFRIYTEDKSQWELTKARFYLVECVRCVIASGLRLAGVSAPEEM